MSDPRGGSMVSRLRPFTGYAVMVVAAVFLFLLIRARGETLRAPTGAIAPSVHAVREATPHLLFHLLLTLLVVIAVSRALGAVLRYVHQPPVMGEMIAGLLLGPSLLGRLLPAGLHRRLRAGHQPVLGSHPRADPGLRPGRAPLRPSRGPPPDRAAGCRSRAEPGGHRGRVRRPRRVGPGHGSHRHPRPLRRVPAGRHHSPRLAAGPRDDAPARGVRHPAAAAGLLPRHP